MVLDGHVKEILSMDFAPNGYQIATGSGDDTVRIWDLRALKTRYIIPAHKSSVSDLKFYRDPTPSDRSGLFLVTAGFDCNVRIWSADEWTLIRNLATDAGKVMSVDVSQDAKFIASASYSRSFHLFGGDKSL